MQSIAVVILNYNGRNYLQQFLPSVLKFSQRADVIIADNASTDDSIKWLKENYPQLKCIILDKNYGFCEGYNRALQQIDHEYTVLLNSDVEVSMNWLDPLEEALHKQPKLAAVQPKIRAYLQKDHFEYAGAAGGFIDTMGYPFCRGRLFNITEEDQGQYNQPIEVFWTSGACMMIRTKLFREHGGFDPDFFAHMEEIDLCWRWQRAGFKLMNIPQSTVYHLGAGTLSKSNPQKTYLNFRNNLDLICRHWTGLELLLKLPLRLVMDWMAAFLFLINGIPRHSFAVFKAQLHFLFRLGSTIEKRKTLRKYLPRHKLKTVYNGAVTLDFFVKRRRRFSELRHPNQ